MVFLPVPVRAGFPSPADDYVAERLDIRDLIVRNPAATFYFRMQGEAMLGAGIFPGDILVVDRSLEGCPGRVVVAVVNDEMLVRLLAVEDGAAVLLSENDAFPPVIVPVAGELLIWGVVSYDLHRP